MKQRALIFLAGFVIILVVAAAIDFAKTYLEQKNVSFPPGESVDIVVDQPLAHATVSSPVEVIGKARGTWFFENTFPVRLLDAQGNVVAAGPAVAEGDWMTIEFVPFKASLSYAVATNTPMTVELHNDNESGLPQNDKELRVPVVLKGVDGSYVKTFWGNNALGVGSRDCKQVFATERFVPRTQTPARAALEQLVAGPSPAETRQGYFTSINSGVAIQKLEIANGTAYADFNDTLEIGVGGSCRVAAIRAQITNTLLQFPTVKNVVISVNGRTEDILQP